ncbi:MAG: hypothetical protein ABIH66_03355, partial [bacterium]
MRLFAGPAFSDFVKARFPGHRLNEAAARGAMEKTGVERLLELHVNIVISLFDAGFPPETAAGHHDAFEAFTGLLHDHGLLSVAALAPSSCFRTGSFKDKKWYALRPALRPGGRAGGHAGGHAGGCAARCMATGRTMACWTSDEWVRQVDGLVKAAAAAGADGFLFERVAFGAGPWSRGGRWFGAMGCHCDRCRELFRAFAAERGERVEGIPSSVRPESPDFRLYAEWRAGVVSECLERWRGRVREFAHGAVVVVSVAGLGQRNSYLEAGADIGGVVAAADVVLAENHNLSRFDRRGLTYDSTTFQILCEHAGVERVASLPRFRGVGFDAVYPPGRFQIVIAEAVAAGGLAHVQAGEFRDIETGEWTVLTDDNFGAHREAVGVYLDWIEKNAEIYEPAEPVAQVVVLHPGEEMRRRW